MNSSVWKKIIFACCIMGLLGLSFLYGGNLENSDAVMQDYEGRSENSDADTLKDLVNDNNESEKGTASDRETVEQNATEEEQESTNPFVQIVMNIKQIGRSSDTPSPKGKNLQDSKVDKKMRQKQQIGQAKKITKNQRKAAVKKIIRKKRQPKVEIIIQRKTVMSKSRNQQSRKKIVMIKKQWSVPFPFPVRHC